MSSYQLNSISSHKKELIADSTFVPVIFHVSDELMPEEKTIQELINTASQPHAFHHVAALSDVHSKKGRRTPTGTAAALDGHLAPQINDTSPNCGMRFIKTNLDEGNFSSEDINKLFTALVKVVPTKKRIGTVVPYSVVMDICRRGVRAAKEHFHTRCKNELENICDGGNFFAEIPNQQDILDAIPKLFLHVGRFRLGILGAAGNHFLDLMKVTEIKNETIARKFGVYKGQYIFMLHTGSGLLGQYASYLYTPKKKEHTSQKIMLEIGKSLFRSRYKNDLKKLFRKINRWNHKDEFFQYAEDGLEGKLFQISHNAVANHGFANRCVLTHHIDQMMEKILGKQVSLDLLYEMPHISIRKENHYGKDVWMHRNGATRANGPERMTDHPLFSQTGEPAFIPSSMSTPAYLGVGTDHNRTTFFSSSHGTGRRRQAQIDAAHGKTHGKKELFEKMERNQMKLYNAKSRGVVLQDSEYYKDIEEVIAGMEENNIVKVVAKMQPVAVLMY